MMTITELVDNAVLPEDTHISGFFNIKIMITIVNYLSRELDYRRDYKGKTITSPRKYLTLLT